MSKDYQLNLVQKDFLENNYLAEKFQVPYVVEQTSKYISKNLTQRYGDSFVGSTVNYGDEFYLKNVAVLQEEYAKAKENGEPDEEIDSIYRQIIQTKYRGNKDKIKRAWTLYNLNPMPHNTLDEAKELASIGAVSDEDFIIKVWILV